MILKGFKENSNKKYIEKLLKQRPPSNGQLNINKIGVLVNSDEISDYSWFLDLSKNLNVKLEDLEIILYKEVEVEGNQFSNHVFNDEALGWKGDIKDEDVKAFVNEKFDILISYYKQEKNILKLITAASNAVFKIGVFENDNRLNDLIIKTSINDVKTFRSEVIKYLQVLNKI